LTFDQLLAATGVNERALRIVLMDELASGRVVLRGSGFARAPTAFDRDTATALRRLTAS
jgi:hypothetical protein